MVLELFTDGARKGDGYGGWGALLRYGDVEKQIFGGEPDTTNNRMELMAVIEGLKALNRGDLHICITTDSQYVIKGATEWMDGWMRRKWRTSEGEPVKNKDLWQELYFWMQQHRQIEWEWVRGHTGHPENELADQLANEGVVWARQNAN